jgi:hypothetical protein
LAKLPNAVLGQETLDQVGWMSWGIVMIQLHASHISVSCAKLLHEDGGLLGSTPYWQFGLVVCTHDAQYPGYMTFTLLRTCCAFLDLRDAGCIYCETGPWFLGHIHTPTTGHWS